MKRYTAMIIRAFLILAIAVSMMPPLRAAAQHPNVTIGGQVTYQPRNWDDQQNNWAIGKEIRVDLYERDLSGNDHNLDTAYTNTSGIFAFPERENWWGPDNRQLNVFFELLTVFTDAEVTNRYFADYAFANSDRKSVV
jgi:hypothetical protein